MIAKDLEQLNEKDLHCIARHLKSYIKKGIISSRNEDPCMNCIYCNEKRILNSFESFKKLFHITGINLNTFLE